MGGRRGGERGATVECESVGWLTLAGASCSIGVTCDAMQCNLLVLLGSTCRNCNNSILADLAHLLVVKHSSPTGNSSRIPLEANFLLNIGSKLTACRIYGQPDMPL